jgi:hypothetical protein
MGKKTTLRLSIDRETKGTVMYSVPNVDGTPFRNLYVSKGFLRDTDAGAFPEVIDVTVEVPES